MDIIDLTTPSLLFSAISLILLAYTNRFLAYASVVRSLKKEYEHTQSVSQIAQIQNFKRRLYLIKAMQIFGVCSLLLCVVATLLFFFGIHVIANICFALALIMLIISFCISIWEINISIKALKIDLEDICPDEPEK